MSDPAGLTITQARAQLEGGELSAVDLVEAVLRRIEARNAELNAYIHLDGDAALAQARDLPEGPLSGIPVCVKDVIDVAGMATTAGAANWERRPDADAAAVARLRAAGAVIVGKGNTNEFAYGIDGRNPHHGDACNPHDPDRVTGGSTAGPAAATAAGLALGALGTDTGGSLRLPGSLCGIAGLRPTLGLVPHTGVLPLAWSYDTAGPMARTVADCALLLEALIERPLPRAAEAAPRLGLLEQLVEGRCEPYVEAGLAAALEALRAVGADVRPVRLEHLRHADAIFTVVQRAEAAAVHAPWFAEQAPHYAPDVRQRLEVARLLPAWAYLAAQRARRLLVEELYAVMDELRLDVLVAPAAPLVAPRRDADRVTVAGREVSVRGALVSLTLPLSHTRGPVLALPIGEHEGLPFGLQLAGRPHDDARVLAIGRAWEAALSA